jgi:hypothetical protein
MRRIRYTCQLINDMNFFDLAADAIDWANAGTRRTANTLNQRSIEYFASALQEPVSAALVEDVSSSYSFAEIL